MEASSRSFRSPSGVFWLAVPLLAATACLPAIPEGQYVCDSDATSPSCPPGWFCREGYCYSTADGGADADVLPDEAGDVDGEGGGDGETTDDGTGCVPAECDDGNSCNGAEVCTVDGACVSTRPPDDGTECRTARDTPGRCFFERCRPDTCGNATVDSGEDCDDGNLVDNDGCDADCLFSCVLSPECDDGETCNGAETCAGHRCVPGEFLADGTSCGTDLICLDGACVDGGCGDGIVDAVAGEECDDANDVPGDGCENDCTFSCESDPDCLDGHSCNGTESCDTVAHRCTDGIPAADGTPCAEGGSPGACRGGSCAPVSCGDGIVDVVAGEECDDRNFTDGDGCDNDCTWSCTASEECADMSVCNGAESCDLGTHRCSTGTPPADGTECDRDGDPLTRDLCVGGACGASTCGDGFRDAVRGEECDDGNDVAGDGCEPGTCTWSCAADAGCDDEDACSGTETCDLGVHTCRSGTPLADGTACIMPGGGDGSCRAGACVRVTCGDGTVGPGEECDDENLVDGDGCDSSCLFSCHSATECREVPDNPCTTDACSSVPGGQRCSHTPNRDSCDDGSACTTPDVCDGAGTCRGTTIDGDADTYGPGAGCGGDCNDASVAVHPGATEICNAIDDDCSSQADDGPTMSCRLGTTRSCIATGAGGHTCSGTETCLASSCTWSGICTVSAAETCNGVDDDCNGAADETFACRLGASESCAAPCGVLGTRTCETGCTWSACRAASETACNGCDDDGDGVTDEGSWCVVTGVPTTANLRKVYGSSATDVWVVGDGGAVVHWNGSSWTTSDSRTTNNLHGVWAASATEAWAVGDMDTIRRWNGSTWTTETVSTGQNFFGVWGSSAADVWAVGTVGQIMHRLSGSWSSSTSGTPRRLMGVWGSSATDVWAVGDNGTIRRWFGSGWVAGPASGVTVTLGGVDGSSGSDVWIPGGIGNMLRWNGSALSSVSSGATRVQPDVCVFSPTAAWTVGGAGEIVRWNGSVWSLVASGTAVGLFGVWGASPAEVWAAGLSGTILRWRE